jgi:acyl-homoserine lactone acylase PvdQ
VSRLCACPCKEPLVGRRKSALYLNDAHAQRAYEQRLRDELRSAGLSPSLSKKLAQTTNGTSHHQADGLTPVSARRSGLQVSYRKAVEAVARAIRETEARYGDDSWQRRPGGNVLLAEEALLPVLPERQRAILAAREQREGTT